MGQKRATSAPTPHLGAAHWLPGGLAPGRGLGATRGHSWQRAPGGGPSPGLGPGNWVTEAAQLLLCGAFLGVSQVAWARP